MAMATILRSKESPEMSTAPPLEVGVLARTNAKKGRGRRVVLSLCVRSQIEFRE